jgi:hypothetical protein
MQRLFIFLFLWLPLITVAQQTIKSNDAHIHYVGRVAVKEAATELMWTGSAVKINFNGTGVKAVLKDERGENTYNVIVDNKVVGIIHPDSARQSYTLITGLTPGNHQLELFKRTEWAMGKTWFYGLELEGKTTLNKAPETKKRKIEFYGNSITCGYAVLDTTGKDRGTAPYEDGYISYAAITARHFDAEYYAIAKSGIGVLISWFPLIMPEMYDRLNPEDANSKWDFKKYTPDLVVINLFQNDAWLVVKPEHAEFKARFGDKAPDATQIISAYSKLVKSIRTKYPKAEIICALGNMDAARKDAPWYGYIQKAVAGLKDKHIYTHNMGYKNTAGHPSVAEQAAMANDLIRFINQKIKW